MAGLVILIHLPELRLANKDNPWLNSQEVKPLNNGLEKTWGGYASDVVHTFAPKTPDVQSVVQNERQILMIDVKQFRELVVRPVLKDLGMWSQAAEDIMVGTAVQESRLTYLEQHGNGPAKGVYQIELPTAKDVLVRYLRTREDLMDKFWVAVAIDPDMDIDNEILLSKLTSDLAFATAVARVKYYMQPEPLPDAGDIEGYARYWKQYYNTHQGKGTVEEFTNNYREHVL